MNDTTLNALRNLVIITAPLSIACAFVLGYVKGKRSAAAQRVCTSEGLAGRASATQPEADTSVVSGTKADSAADDGYWKCPACGSHDYWFDRSITVLHDGTEGMANRCCGCGRDIDEPMPPTLPAAGGSEARPANGIAERHDERKER